MYYIILYLEALSGGPSWVFSINQSINPRTLSQSPHGTSPPKLTSPILVSTATCRLDLENPPSFPQISPGYPGYPGYPVLQGKFVGIYQKK